jgi:hypothetical protein
MDTRPTTAYHDALTGITEVREMTEAEYAQHLEDVANAEDNAANPADA